MEPKGSADYFTDDPVYNDDHFRRRFRLTQQIFEIIMHTLARHDRYFVQRKDCTGMLGLSSYQKCTAALRMHACRSAVGSLDAYVCMSASTVSKTLQHFTRGIIAAYNPTYMSHIATDATLPILVLPETPDSPICLEVSTAVNECGRIAPLHGTANIKEKMELHLSL